MKAKVWLISWLVIVISVLCVLGFGVYKIDPYFHYHEPILDKYFYVLDNQRSQNDGISKHFDYDALITGTSMTENFRTTEADRIFGCNSIKVAYSGGTYKEINDNIEKALEANPNLKLVIRCLDMGRFLDMPDSMRWDLGFYPTYLYDSNPFNDVEYLLNRDIVFGRAYKMTSEINQEGFNPGMTTFDEYSRWQTAYVFGIDTVNPSGFEEIGDVVGDEKQHLSAEEKEAIKKNIYLNVTSVAEKYPDTNFYYFYSPYSIGAWSKWKTDGSLYKMLEAEAFITELIVPYENIHLFSFNSRTDITTDLNNYKDNEHYATWINSLILKWMHDGQFRLTEENYKDYLKQEYDFYTTFDYSSVNGQEDYEADFYAAALLNKELTGAEPLEVLNDSKVDVKLNGAEYITDESNRNAIIDCFGTLARDYATEDLAEYIRDIEFIGAKFIVNLDEGYNYLCFNGQKITDQGQLTVCVYDEAGVCVRKVTADYLDLDNEVHQYVIDLSTINGKVTVILNGGYVDCTGSLGSNYQFSDVYMY